MAPDLTHLTSPLASSLTECGVRRRGCMIKSRAFWMVVCLKRPEAEGEDVPHYQQGSGSMEVLFSPGGESLFFFFFITIIFFKP